VSGIPNSLENVINSFSKFPGIGKKTAQRLGFHVLKTEKLQIQEFAQSLIDVKEKIKFCERCHNFSEDDLCSICVHPKRNNNTICVVEEPSDIILFEKTDFSGVYHVIGGVLSPLDGIGPNDLNIKTLLNRLDEVDEIIIATNTSVEGDATALYLAKLLHPLDINVTRLARGLPVGGHLEYVDEATLSKSMNERVKI
jgi:recombination protein RecR